MPSFSTTPFTTVALVRAMAPIDLVIDTFLSPLTNNDNGDDGQEGNALDVPAWASPEVGQHKFAQIVTKVVAPPFKPTRRYLRRLLTRYALKIERDAGVEIEDETLAELIAEHAFGPSCSIPGGSGLSGGDAPDPNAYGYVSFAIPEAAQSPYISDDIVGVRIYPHHNDVGIRKLWEAGGALAEYLIMHPELIKGRVVLELGAGVGLTGIVVAGLCGTKRLHMTDYTESVFGNMKHTIDINSHWLGRKGVNVETDEGEGRELTFGYLEWSEYAKDGVGLPNVFAFSDAEVLLAADVVYDIEEIPNLVATVRRLLQGGKKNNAATTPQLERKAIFATTFRNTATFALFSRKLHSEGIKCEYTDEKVMESLPKLFPCYFHQPRKDVRICTMTAEY